MAWSWHEIVSDFVRPTLMWFEAKGQADLNALVKQYSLNGNLRCLTEYKEGCPVSGGLLFGLLSRPLAAARLCCPARQPHRPAVARRLLTCTLRALPLPQAPIMK